MCDAAGQKYKCSFPDLFSQQPAEVLLAELGSLHIPKQMASIHRCSWREHLPQVYWQTQSIESTIHPAYS